MQPQPYGVVQLIPPCGVKLYLVAVHVLRKQLLRFVLRCLVGLAGDILPAPFRARRGHTGAYAAVSGQIVGVGDIFRGRVFVCALGFLLRLQHRHLCGVVRAVRLRLQLSAPVVEEYVVRRSLGRADIYGQPFAVDAEIYPYARAARSGNDVRKLVELRVVKLRSYQRSGVRIAYLQVRHRIVGVGAIQVIRLQCRFDKRAVRSGGSAWPDGLPVEGRGRIGDSRRELVVARRRL